MDQSTRNTLRNVVTQCRKLLEESVAQVLQGQFGIYAAGKKDEVQIEPEARMSHLSEEDRAYRQDLLDHYEHIKALGYKSKDALAQLIREVAFTHLNRFCAYRMMESRGLIRESVSKGLKSQGFLFYLADHEEDERRFNTGQQDVAYRHFLNWLGGTLSEEIGVLFAPTDPANRLYPPQRVIDQVLGQLNDPELAGIWSEDEAIGWVYQYFTPKELRDQARKESQAPRNSYELAFRNQFFTPRYVVEFLTDNTLGRIWYEMRQGNTRLQDQCRYMVRRPAEVFLKNGEAEPGNAATATDDLSQEQLLKLPVYVPFRAKKDPRELRILDPACGSGHFLLYCFDLLLAIYEEAYGDPDLGPALKKDYPTLEDLRRDVPRLILAHNLHGIDIDPRASQIAALALWLRCQRAYQDMGLKQDRPKITRSNIVCAEPMPGEERMLKEFVDQLEPKVLGQVVEVVFDKMKLAGEAGSLLKIEEEIRDAVAAAKKQYTRETTHATDRKGRALLFSEAEMGRLAAGARKEPLFDVSDVTDAAFFEQAETRATESLRLYAESATTDQRHQRQLFSADAAAGFAFVDLCEKPYDVVLMNPPFGQFSKKHKELAKLVFPNSYNDLLCAFAQRWCQKLSPNGRLGAITSRTPFFIASASAWRETFLLKESAIDCFADLGENVMDDAMVESSAYVLHRPPQQHATVFFRLLGLENRDRALLELVSSIRSSIAGPRCFIQQTGSFGAFPASPFAYWLDPHLRTKLSTTDRFEPSVAQIRVGLTTLDNFRFVRALWEVPENSLGTNGDFGPQSRKAWAPLVIGGKSQPWFSPILVCVKWENNGQELRAFIQQHGSESRWIRSPGFYFRPGFSWTRRASRLIPYAIPSGCIPTASRYMAYPEPDSEFVAIGVAASNVASAFLRCFGEWFCRPNFLVENMKALPWPSIPNALREALSERVRQEVVCRRSVYQHHEPFHEFTVPSIVTKNTGGTDITCNLTSFLGSDLEFQIATAYGLNSDEYDSLVRDLAEAVLANQTHDADDDDDDDAPSDDVVITETEFTRLESLISYCVGVALGRWDVRLAIGTNDLPELSGPFASLPAYPPGTLTDSNGLPARQTPDDYPVAVEWTGILTDASDDPRDIVRQVRDVLSSIWGEQADSIAKLACERLGSKDLRDYFRKPGKGGFWEHHVARYTKSRRRAPIYWLLQSSKKSYAIWLYYHRLDKDILFKALVNYVEPKIRLETDRLESLRAQKGEGGKATKKLDKEIEKQEEFLSELRDFEEKLRRAAELHLVPDLNDGVVLNIAPLHELVPWKEAEKYWEELLEGKYEWSSIGKQLREKGLVK